MLGSPIVSPPILRVHRVHCSHSSLLISFTQTTSYKVASYMQSCKMNVIDLMEKPRVCTFTQSRGRQKTFLCFYGVPLYVE